MIQKRPYALNAGQFFVSRPNLSLVVSLYYIEQLNTVFEYLFRFLTDDFILWLCAMHTPKYIHRRGHLTPIQQENVAGTSMGNALVQKIYRMRATLTIVWVPHIIETQIQAQVFEMYHYHKVHMKYCYQDAHDTHYLFFMTL